MSKTIKGLTVALALAASTVAFAQNVPQQQAPAQALAFAGAPYGVPGYYGAPVAPGYGPYAAPYAYGPYYGPGYWGNPWGGRGYGRGNGRMSFSMDGGGWGNGNGYGW
jgi:hypothetical protein